jgi:hypothetical protein
MRCLDFALSFTDPESRIQILDRFAFVSQFCGSGFKNPGPPLFNLHFLSLNSLQIKIQESRSTLMSFPAVLINSLHSLIKIRRLRTFMSFHFFKQFGMRLEEEMRIRIQGSKSARLYLRRVPLEVLRTQFSKQIKDPVRRSGPISHPPNWFSVFELQF